MFAVVIDTLVAIVTVVAIGQLVCFALALYELLNLTETQGAHLDAATLLAACTNLVVETVTLLAVVLLAPLGALPSAAPRRGGDERPALLLVATWPIGRVCFWVLRRRLARDGWRDAALVSPRVFGTDLAREAQAVARAVDALAAGRTPPPIILLGHGTGGVVCRAYLRWYAGSGRVAKLVTLASPHQGSKLYALATSRLLRELRPESPLLAELAENDPLPSTVDCTAIYSSFDLYVLPSRLAYYPGAGNIEVEGVGHFAMLWSSRVYELIRENVEYAPHAASPADGSGTQPAA